VGDAKTEVPEMKSVAALIKLLNRIAEVLVITISASLTTVIPLAVLFRYALNNSLVWQKNLRGFFLSGWYL